MSATAVERLPFARPITTLLPASDAAMRASLAQMLAAQVRETVEQGWAVLLRSCMESLSERSAAALCTATLEAPAADLLMTRLDGTITPGVLLSLPVADRAWLETALLAHEDAQVREQTLDALQEAGAGRGPLRDACTSWSMRMLVAELGRVPGLSHSERLALQDRMLAHGAEPAGDVWPEPEGANRPEPQAFDRPEPQALRDALRGGGEPALAILAGRAGIKPEAATMAASLRDPRMLAALCWRAECDRSESFAIQVQLGRISPDKVLAPDPEGRWPLDAARLQWHAGILEAL